MDAMSNCLGLMMESGFLAEAKRTWEKIPENLRDKYGDVHNLSFRINDMYMSGGSDAVATVLNRGDAANVALIWIDRLTEKYGRGEVERVNAKLSSIGWRVCFGKPLDVIRNDALRYIGDMHKMNYVINKEK